MSHYLANMEMHKTMIVLFGMVISLGIHIEGHWSRMAEGGELYSFGIPEAHDPNPNITLYISTERSATVHVEAPYVQLNMTRFIQKTSISLRLDPRLALTGSSVSKKGVSIKSDSRILVHALIEDVLPSLSSDGFLAIPIAADSKEFYIVSYSRRYTSSTHEFVISVQEDNTEVVATIKVSSGNVLFEGRRYPDKSIVRKVLNKYDTLQIQSSGDLTGTYVNSSKPIGVQSGNQCLSMYGSCDVVVDHLQPVADWKTNYITSNGVNGITAIRIMASEDGTSLEINNRVVSTLQKGAFYEKTMTSTGILSIKGSRPIVVVQFYDPAGSDPFMATVPAMNQFLTSYTFEVPTGYRSNNLIVYVETNKTDGVTLDGRVVRMTDMKTINVPSLSTSFSAGKIALTEGKHKLTHTIHGTQFGALLYGIDSSVSYGFFLGYSNGPVCSPACRNNGTCLAGNTCHCQLGYLGQRCELGTDLASELKPRLYTLVDDKGNSFMDPMAWYADPPISDTNKVCYVKILVKNSTIETLAAAISSTTDGVEYGNFTTGPLDSTAGVTGLTRFACLEVRCPFVTLDGTPRDTVIDVSLTGNNSEACRIRDHSAHVTNFTIQSEDDKSEAFQFVLEVGKNYGPYYGVYMAIGSRDKAKFLAERKCGSGNEYDYESYNPSAGVLAEYSC